MKKIILLCCLMIFVFIGCSQVKQESPKPQTSSKRVYTLIPMGDSTTLQIQYENSTTVVHLILPSKPDLLIEKVENITYVEDTPLGTSRIMIKFNSDYTTQFAELTEKNKENYLAIIAGGKVLGCPVIKDRVFSPEIPILWTESKEESSQFIESIKGKPLECYAIPRK